MLCEDPPSDGLVSRISAFLSDRSAGAVTGPRRMSRDELVDMVASVARSEGAVVSVVPDAPADSPDVVIYRHWSLMGEGPEGEDVLYGQDLCHQVPSVARLRRVRFRESHLSPARRWTTMDPEPLGERFNPWRDRIAFGVLALVAGILLLVLDDGDFQAAVACFGVFAVAVGLLQLAYGRRSRFVWNGVTGVAMAVSGVAVAVLSFLAAGSLRIILGAGMAVSGLVLLAGMARGYALAKWSRFVALVFGLVLLAAGISLAAWPDLDADAAMLGAGIVLVVTGVFVSFGAYNLRRVDDRGRF